MIDIKDKFLELTSRTYPHGTEADLFPILNPELQEDEFGNLFIKIGDSDVMFTSHLDTATSCLSEVVHVFEGDDIKTDGMSILGADDKAGVTIMLYMIENKIPGLYYFFLGEEVGCVGSKKVADKYKTEKIEGINKVISFDRRGTSSIITFQSGSRCCSDKFGDELSKQLNSLNDTFSYKNDTTGLLTDSIQFVKLYPECTNISVGYQNEHTFTEVQNINHLEKLAKACLDVDWNNLPVERDPSVTEYSYGGGDYYGWGAGSWESNSSWEGARSWEKPIINRIDKTWFHDKRFNYVSCVEISTIDKKIVTVDLCEERIQYETGLIENLLGQLDILYDKFKWDGMLLNVFYTGGVTTCDRNELLEYLPEMDYNTIEDKTQDRGSDLNGYCEDLYD